ncbi:ATPase/GTPase, AAA15 family [Chryseobacterium taeanense]|uniref:ATPase/GTPase, AAA15 family n=1 Tax=Chryseobacterium taeanense TaxID=311334 RepID=A0A1G8HUW7_9FLAO|nr:AAA family ATPase [Chryseobacterium taeanense]SDI10438.1 ATPase/GTPase, AAA15 family [Chryseobacterium taeanense]
MENQHLTYFKVENFKKFDSLEVKDIGQFNLIVGDNNVGKTCFLEALLFDKSKALFAINILDSLRRRGLLEYKTSADNNISITSSLNERRIKNRILKNVDEGVAIFSYIDEKDQNLLNKIILKSSFYSSKRIDNDLDFFHNNISFDEIKNVSKYLNITPFIGFNSLFTEDIYSLYNNIKTKSDKENLIRTIQVIDTNIIDVELRQNFEDLNLVFLLSFKNKDEFIPVNYLGDGFKRIFYIILKIMSLKGKRIMIDEIETGIHYSRQKDFWSNILKICNELDVQLFASTHSKECIQAFYEAGKELNEQKDIRLISLQEGEQDKIYSTTYNFKNIEAGLYSDIELRA